MQAEEKINVLIKIAHRLNAAGIVWAVGGSMFLYFKGITTEFRDIDLMILPADAETVKAILEQMGTLEPPKSSARFKSKAFYEFILDGVDVDVMAGLVIVKDGIEHDRSLRDSDIPEYMQLDDEIIPLHSLAVWRRNYELMDKLDKVRLIDSKKA